MRQIFFDPISDICSNGSMFPTQSHFMVVDDSTAIRTLINQQLNALGFKNIIEAEEGADALTKLERHYKAGHALALLIVDWKMPGLNGLDLLRHLKQHSIYKDIPVLMIAAEHDMENVAEALGLGAADFILKPFDESILIEKINSIWKRIAV